MISGRGELRRELRVLLGQVLLRLRGEAEEDESRMLRAEVAHTPGPPHELKLIDDLREPAPGSSILFIDLD